MRNLNDALEKNVEELEHARDDAIQRSAEKSVFIANISHEVRTPLSGIIGTVELLLEQPLSSEETALAQTVQHSADALLSIVNDLLDLSKMEAGGLELRMVPCDPAAIVRECTRLMSVNARAKRLYCHDRIDEKMPAHIMCDPARLRQILLNLIGNSIKFTHSGGIMVDVAVLELSNHWARLQFNVIDTGIGISEQNLTRLFKPFSQLDTPLTGRPGGTGLGLSISRQLARLMGGDIVAHSELGVGSTFCVTIRCDIPPADVLAATMQPGADDANVEPPLLSIRQGSKCLIVEDNPVLQNLAKKQLQALGIEVDTASDGNEALAAAAKKGYDLILMDVHLPAVNGYDVTSAIRDLETGTDKHIPIVAMTASAMPADREKCFRAGMDDYLSKPVKMKDMLNVVRRWLSLTRNQPRIA